MAFSHSESRHPAEKASVLPTFKQVQKEEEGGSFQHLSVWTFLIFHVSEHIWALFTICRQPMLSQIDSNEIFRPVWQRVQAVYFGGRFTAVSLVARLISLRLQLNRLGGDSSEGGGCRFGSTVQRWTLINILGGKGTEGQKEGGEGVTENRTPFCSCQVLVSDCTNTGHRTATTSLLPPPPPRWEYLAALGLDLWR